MNSQGVLPQATGVDTSKGYVQAQTDEAVALPPAVVSAGDERA
jgi:hypothetical protein